VRDLTGDDKRVERSAAPDFSLLAFSSDAVLARLEQNSEMTLVVSRELGAGSTFRSDKGRIRERPRAFHPGSNWTRMTWRNHNEPINSGFANCRRGLRCRLSTAKTRKGQETD